MKHTECPPEEKVLARCRRSPAGIEAGVYRGKIADRYPITLVVEGVDWNGQARARYFYDEQGKAIWLQPSPGEDGSVVLDEAGTPPARFELRPTPEGALLGTWTQEGKPPQQVELR